MKRLHCVWPSSLGRAWRPRPIPDLKRQLAVQLVRLMHGWTPGELFFAYHIDQPRVSDLRRGKLDRFSLEKLIRLLKRMKHSVQISVVKDPIVWRRQVPRAHTSGQREPG